MQAMREVRGRMVPLDRSDVDTDQIMAKQHLKRVDRQGFGEVVFENWREDPDFVLNDPRFAGASVLVTGRNFGAGSSREHAVWGLQQYGFEAVISPRFADIFRSNAEKVGLLAIELPEEAVRQLMDLARREPGTEVYADVAAQRLVASEVVADFELNPYSKTALMEGWDYIDMTLRHDKAITGYEVARNPDLPTIR